MILVITPSVPSATRGASMVSGATTGGTLVTLFCTSAWATLASIA